MTTRHLPTALHGVRRAPSLRAPEQPPGQRERHDVDDRSRGGDLRQDAGRFRRLETARARLGQRLIQWLDFARDDALSVAVSEGLGLRAHPLVGLVCEVLNGEVAKVKLEGDPD